jgi:hypothetical protein
MILVQSLKKNNYMSDKLKFRSGVLVLMVFIAAFSRLIPHPPNFTPIGGMALFGAAYFSRKYLSFLVPLAAMWVSDLFYNNVILPAQLPEYYTGFQWFGNLWVYAGFALIVLIGFKLLKKVKPSNIAIAALSGAVVFYLITNLGAWAMSPIYTKDLTGLIACYAAAIPFFGNSLLGIMVYSTVLFGVFEWAKQRVPALQA